MTKPSKKQVQKLENKEHKANEALMENLFYDNYQRRRTIYRINFNRGIFFGLGSALGGTIVLAIIIAMLTFFIQIPGGIGDFVKWVVENAQR